MNLALHAFLAKRLIDACGGTKGAAVILSMSDGNVSRYKDHRYGQVLRADQIGDLEAACKDPIYSRALVEAVEPVHAVAAITDEACEACEAAEAAVSLQRVVRLAAADGQLTPRERDQVRSAAIEARDQVTDVLTRLDATDSAA